jgi:hypothetical protein
LVSIMKKILVSLAFLLLSATSSWASCTGQFASGQACGNTTGVLGVPTGVGLSPLLDSAFGAPSAQGTILNRGTSVWSQTVSPVLGNPGTTTGTLGLGSLSGGTATITPPAIAGATALQLPSLAGTFPSTATLPIVLNATTGALTCPTCVVGSGGALAVGTTTISSGTTNGLLYDNAGILGNLATANNGVLITSGAGAPSISSTLPSSLAIPAPTITGGSATALTGLGIRSTGTGAFDLTFANTENLTAGRTLTFTVNDAARTVSLSGNLTLGGALATAAAFTQSGAFATTLTSSGITDSTLPSGTHTLAGLDVAQTWSALQQFNSGDFALKGATSGTLVQHAAAIAGSSVLTWPAGTTDFSATGGTSQVVKQVSAGAPFTVGQLAFSDISGTATLAQGGTNASLTASNGGIFYSTASAGAILSGTATANLPLLSGASTTPAWATISYPTSANSGGIPYFSSATAITSSAALGSGQIVLGGGAGASPTTSANASISSGALSLGANASVLGSVKLFGSTSGDVTVKAAAVAGTSTIFQLPPSNGSSGYVLQTDGTGITSWVNPTAGGTVTSVAAGTGMSFATITTSGSVAIDKATAANFEAGTSNKVLTADNVFTSETTTTFSATPTFDFSTFFNTAITLTASITSITCSNQKAGQSGTIRFIQDATGSRTLPATFGCNFKFQGDIQPILSTTANAVDAMPYSCSAANYCVASLIKNVQ